MGEYVGFDVSKAATAFCMMDEGGRVLARASVARNSGRGDKLLEAFRRATPMRQLGKPGDIPGVVAFLASSDADFITGQVISVSGGRTMGG